jgi:2-keto-4-pentenoate hydratase/2-oxohepta-3-ene-1,7-dioic acid hydratase in catechol pathway
VTNLYRLAVVGDAKETRVIAERGGSLFPLQDALSDQEIASLGGPPADLQPLLNDWERWRTLLPQRIDGHLRSQPTLLDEANLHFRPPVRNPGKLLCIGANYHDHIEEMKIPMTPTYPYSFLKPSSTTFRGSGDSVAVPPGVKMMDWEAELAAVIGKSGHRLNSDNALSIVAGYTNFNDLSARDWIATRPAVGIDWVQHKAFDGFGPIGPYFVPAEFVPDPQQLPIELKVNGVVKQSSSTSKMVFGVAQIIEHLSAIMTLEPGDIIATGTPAGVAGGYQPPVYLKPGDVITMSVGDCGQLETWIV